MRAALLLLIAFPLVAQDVSIPQRDLSVKEFVSFLADYDVKHVDQQPFYMPAFGVTNFDSTPPTVWIFNTGDTVSRRETVIHEFLHIRYHQLGLDPPEEFIRSEEQRMYLKLFGGDHAER